MIVVGYQLFLEEPQHSFIKQFGVLLANAMVRVWKNAQ
jgi:hypothetical protein